MQRERLKRLKAEDKRIRRLNRKTSKTEMSPQDSTDANGGEEESEAEQPGDDPQNSDDPVLPDSWNRLAETAFSSQIAINRGSLEFPSLGLRFSATGWGAAIDLPDRLSEPLLTSGTDVSYGLRPAALPKSLFHVWDRLSFVSRLSSLVARYDIAMGWRDHDENARLQSRIEIGSLRRFKTAVARVDMRPRIQRGGSRDHFRVKNG